MFLSIDDNIREEEGGGGWLMRAAFCFLVHQLFSVNDI